MHSGKDTSKTLHLAEIALLIAVGVFLLSGASALKTQQQLSEKVVRLHVLANSDTQEDQALKLKVRDAVLSRATEILEGAPDRSAAEAALRGQLLELEALASETLSREGCADPVTVGLEKTPFPTREYDGFLLPPGEYLALRVVIGEGAGQNWWCVVFPPLCTAAVSEIPAAAMAAGLDDDQVRLITEADEGYVLKFKVVELWEQLRTRFE